MADGAVPTSVSIEEEKDEAKLRDHIANLERNLADWTARKEAAGKGGALPVAPQETMGL